MAIHQLLREASFSPEETDRTIAAYDAALILLHLTDGADPVAELVARKIIEIVRGGEYDPPRICARTLKELGVPLPE
jgi:hypothetical protein